MKIIFLMMAIFLMSNTAFGVGDDEWGYCKGNVAYHDKAFKKPKPIADWVCKLPTARELGDLDGNKQNERCTQLQEMECKIGAGGSKEAHAMKSHKSEDDYLDRGVYFAARGFNTGFMRCQCGCFTEDVLIDTVFGNTPIGYLAQTAKHDPFRVLIPDLMGDFKVSEWLTLSDFTIGPEDKPIIRITTDTGDSITLTDQHPVIVIRDYLEFMIQASELKLGDKLVGRYNNSLIVTSLETYKLPKEDNNVYNIDTRGSTAREHILIANGIKVGDVKWQNYLSQQGHRAKMLLAFSAL